MPTRTTFRLAAGAVAAGLSLLALPASPAAAQSASTPAGAFADAQGVVVNLTALTAVPIPGPLGSTPLNPNTFSRATQTCPEQEAEAATDNLANVPAAPAATASAVTTSARAQCATGPTSVAVAQTEGVAALFQAGVPVITADSVRAQANSDCTRAPNGDGTFFANLRVGTQTFARTPAPNTRITIPGLATVILNEQNPAAGGRGIVVNAIHVIGASPLLRGDLIISHAVSGVTCPNGRGSEVAEGLQAPAITFGKTANPSTARAGQTVTYTATVRNTGATPCDVISFIDHLDPVFEFVSTSGTFGTEAVSPVTVRPDEGQDVVLRPRAGTVVLAAGDTATQQFVVRLRDDVAPGTYFNNLEIFCAVNGDFFSGPLAPVTVPGAAQPVMQPAEQVLPTTGEPFSEALPRTGSPALLGAGALLLLLGGFGVRRLVRS